MCYSVSEFVVTSPVAALVVAQFHAAPQRLEHAVLQVRRSVEHRPEHILHALLVARRRLAEEGPELVRVNLPGKCLVRSGGLDVGFRV